MNHELNSMTFIATEGIRLWHTAFDAINDAIAILDHEGRILKYNSSFGDLIAKNAEEIIGNFCHRLVHQTESFIENCPVTRARTSLQRETLEMKFLGKWFRVMAHPIFDKAGKVIGFVHVMSDISATKRAKEMLIERERDLSAVVDNLPGLVSRVDRDLRYRFASKGYERVFGFRPQDVIGRTMAEIIGPETFKQIEAYAHRALAGEQVTFESPIKKPTGEMEYGLVSFVPDAYADGTIQGFLILAMDITARKQAEEALRKQSEFLAVLLETIPRPIYYKDAAGKYMGCNKAFEEFVGRSRVEIIGKTVYALATPERADQLHQMDLELLAAPGKQTYERQVEGRSGELRHVIFNKATILHHDRIEGIIGVISDITARRRSEEEREKLREQLHQAQKIESIGRLAGGVAHDFNNKLGVIIGHAEIMQEVMGPADPLRPHLLEIIKSARRSAELTRQLLAFARKQTISPKVLDLNELISGMLSMLRRLIGEDIELAWHPGAGLWPVRMDPTQIDQILANLAVNARDAITGVGHLTIRTENRVVVDERRPHSEFVPGEYVLLSVSDTGCGMSAESLERLFEPFYTTKEVGKGTGLGLATVYGIVKQNDGFIHVQSQAGKGTVFSIYLPRVAVENPVRAVPATTAKPTGGSETILLVEDEDPILELSMTILTRYGYTVLAAKSPEEALAISESNQGPLHLLITDVILPQMNGRDLQELIKSRYPEIRTLFMSGYTADVIARHGVLDDGVDFLEKPFSIHALTAKVREVLEKSD